MTVFRIHWLQSVSTTTEVEAETLDEAIEASWDLLPGSLCHQCAATHELSEEWTEIAAYAGDSDVDLLDGSDD